MKKTAFLLTMLLFAFFSQAQYDQLKSSLLLGKYKEAKAELDKKMSNEKFASKAEAYMLKATIYADLAADSATRLTPEGKQLEADAEAAFAKYREMDPSLELMKDPVYKNGPINIYSNLFSAGYKEYEAKNWAASYDYFKKTSEMSDLLYAQKVLTASLDTNVMILAAYTAENSNNKDEAVKYYKRMADAKVKGDGYEGVYRFLVTYNFEKKNMEDFEKYRLLGKELYPESEFFTYDKTDFAVGLDANFNSKIKSLEDVLAKDPTNYKANLSLGQIIYDTLNSDIEGAKPPANAAELEPKMIAAFNAASAAKPDDVLPYLYLGDHYIKKKERQNQARAAHVKDMQSRTSATAKPSAADVQKRDDLNKQMWESYDAMQVNYEKAANLLSKKGELTRQEKQQYKTVAGYLGDYYTDKATLAKGKPAEAKTYTDLSTKWNDLYGSIK